MPKRLGKEAYDFLASVHQRVQAYIKSEGKYGELTLDQKVCIEEGISRLGDYLNNQIHSVAPFRLYLFPFGTGRYSQIESMPSNWNRYIKRHTEMDIIVSDKNTIFGSYFKIGPWVSFCLLRNIGQPWIGGDVMKRSTRYLDRTSVLPPTMIDFLRDRAAISQKLMASMSERQKSKVQEAILEGDLLTNGREMFEAILADVEDFGPRALGG